MSEAKSSKKKAAKAKTETAPKAESKSESAAPKVAESADSADSKPAASSDTKSSDSDKESGKESGTDASKSARDSIGGKSDVHYGYFSSVRTPEYRSGWDAIWGGNNGADGGDDDGTPRQRRTAAARTSRPAKARKRRDPITVTLDLDDLPPELKERLVEIASARLKESRVSYARRDKAGAIDWRITCRVD